MEQHRQRGERRLPEGGVDHPMPPALGEWREILEQELRLARAPRGEQGQGLRRPAGEQGEHARRELGAPEMPRVFRHWPTLAKYE